MVVFSFNAVIPEPDLKVIKAEVPFIEKIENNFTNNENSVYQILKEKKDDDNFSKKKPIKKKYDSELIANKIESLQRKDKKNSDTTDKKFKVQFMSLKDKKKSQEASQKLKKKLDNDKFNFNLIIKEIKIDGEVYFRVLSEKSFSFQRSKQLCEKLKKKMYKCLVVKI